eukprot:2824232-Rhodomonas_salina.1
MLRRESVACGAARVGRVLRVLCCELCFVLCMCFASSVAVLRAVICAVLGAPCCVSCCALRCAGCLVRAVRCVVLRALVPAPPLQHTFNTRSTHNSTHIQHALTQTHTHTTQAT